MRHLNYTHLLYFWTVAQEGSVSAAAGVLNLTPQTISGQIKLLEDTIGESLFTRVGRGLVLSETGHVVKQYADEIFQLGAELTQRVKNKEPLVSSKLNVGVVDSIPKLVALRVLEPVLAIEDRTRLVCHEGSLEPLVAELAIHNLDLVISDRPLTPGIGVRAFSHLLGESGISLFAHKSKAAVYKKKFPACLEAEPVLLPLDSPMRRALNEWFDSQGIQPRVVAEFSDSAQLKAFGEAAHGVFPAPSAIANEVASMYHSECIGECDVSERYYAISPERKIKHPAALAVIDGARKRLFA